MSCVALGLRIHAWWPCASLWRVETEARWRDQDVAHAVLLTIRL